jgi:hypothetical protein
MEYVFDGTLSGQHLGQSLMFLIAGKADVGEAGRPFLQRHSRRSVAIDHKRQLR